MTDNGRKEVAFHEGVLYILEPFGSGRRIRIAGRDIVVIPDAKNGWDDLLTYLQEVQRCSNR